MNWRGTIERTPGYLAVAVAAMAAVGFGFAGIANVAGSLQGHVNAAGPHGLTVARVGTTHSGGPRSFGVKKESSSIWAGYGFAPKKKYDGTVTQVYAWWEVPSATCNETSGYTIVLEYAGIDGLTNHYLEAAGIEILCTAPTAIPYYVAFYAFNGVFSDFSNTVSAYDEVFVSVTYSPPFSLYTTTISDLTSASGYTEGWSNSSLSFGGPDASAECVSSSIVGVAVTNYGSMFFTCSATVGTVTAGIGDFSKKLGTTWELTQYGATYLDQLPSSLSTISIYVNDSFLVTWENFD